MPVASSTTGVPSASVAVSLSAMVLVALAELPIVVELLALFSVTITVSDPSITASSTTVIGIVALIVFARMVTVPVSAV